MNEKSSKAPSNNFSQTMTNNKNGPKGTSKVEGGTTKHANDKKPDFNTSFASKAGAKTSEFNKSLHNKRTYNKNIR
jgi:hypothetical protein